jgi:hypothetical protein
LKLAAVEETRLFIQAMLGDNLPARTIVNSDFTFLNERLAKHYGIAGVTGARMRRVTLPQNSVRNRDRALWSFVENGFGVNSGHRRLAGCSCHQVLQQVLH